MSCRKWRCRVVSLEVSVYHHQTARRSVTTSLYAFYINEGPFLFRYIEKLNWFPSQYNLKREMAIWNIKAAFTNLTDYCALSFQKRLKREGSRNKLPIAPLLCLQSVTFRWTIAAFDQSLPRGRNLSRDLYVVTRLKAARRTSPFSRQIRVPAVLYGEEECGVN